ncbi:hypothetical protein DPMN_161544, partial [Dreissena polymorpha]
FSMADAGRRKDTIRHDELPMTIPQALTLTGRTELKLRLFICAFVHAQVLELNQRLQ